MNKIKEAFEKLVQVPDAWSNPMMQPVKNGFILGWEAAVLAEPDIEEMTLTQIAARHEQAEQEPEVWYCPDCGTLSETQVKCCPDWIRSRKVPKNFALTCKSTFDRNGQAEQEPQHSEHYWQHEINNARADGYERGYVAAKKLYAEQSEQEPVVKIHKYNEFQTLGSLNLPIGTKLYAAPVRTKDYNPDVIFNDDGTFSLTLPDGDELRIIPPQQEPTAEVTEDGYAWGKDGILPANSLLYAAPVRTKELTDDEIAMCMGKDLWNVYKNQVDFARAVIAADRKKNK